MTDAISIYIVAGDFAEAERIAEALIQDRLAACVNILGAVKSVYRWQGVVEKTEEIALLAKSSANLFDALSIRVRELHGYDTPAIVAWPIIAGDAAYLDWIRDETSQT